MLEIEPVWQIRQIHTVVKRNIKIAVVIKRMSLTADPSVIALLVERCFIMYGMVLLPASVIANPNVTYCM
jgi:hypothetical protein